MAFVIGHDLEVDAPAERVWEVITDLDRYGEWNPFVPECRSSLRPGEPIDMKVKLLGPPQSQREYITDRDEGRGFAYSMKPMPLGALSSWRSHAIEPLDAGRSRYRSHFQLDGWLAPVVRALLGRKLEAGFESMSHAVKKRAEEFAREQRSA